jgi:hypothetical protein
VRGVTSTSPTDREAGLWSGAAGWERARLWWLTVDGADDLSRQIADLDITVLRGASKAAAALQRWWAMMIPLAWSMTAREVKDSVQIG